MLQHTARCNWVEVQETGFPSKMLSCTLTALIYYDAPPLQWSIMMHPGIQWTSMSIHPSLQWSTKMPPEPALMQLQPTARRCTRSSWWWKSNSPLCHPSIPPYMMIGICIKIHWSGARCSQDAASTAGAWKSATHPSQTPLWCSVAPLAV